MLCFHMLRRLLPCIALIFKAKTLKKFSKVQPDGSQWGRRFFKDEVQFNQLFCRELRLRLRNKITAILGYWCPKREEKDHTRFSRHATNSSQGCCLIKRFVDNIRSKLSQHLFTQNTSSTREKGIRDESFFSKQR